MSNIDSEVTFGPPGIWASESSVKMTGPFARHNLVLVGASGQEWGRISSHRYCKRKLIISKLNQIDEDKWPDYFFFLLPLRNYNFDYLQIQQITKHNIQPS